MFRWKRRGAIVSLASILLAIAVAGGLTIYAQQPADSKLAGLITDRINQVSSAQAAGTFTAQTAAALSSPLLIVGADGQLEVEFHAARAVGQADSAALVALGATILASTGDIQWPAGITPPPNLGVIAVRIPAANILQAAALDWVVAVTPVERQTPDVGAFVSEGVALHNTAAANNLGFTGAGTTVGVVSDGVSNRAAAQALGDLPPVINVLNAGSGDEGTAMLEIIHDLAPNAALAFHGTGAGVAGHITALNNLAGAGVHVIAEDIPFDAEPAFQKGAAATAAESLVVAGVSMHSSAGNLGNSHSARVAANGTAQGPDGNGGPFAGCPYNPLNTVAIAPGGDTTFDVSVASGNTLSAVLQWSEPRAIFPTPGRGGFTNLDLFVFDQALTTCLASSNGAQANGVGDTIEQVSWNNGGANTATVKIVVNVAGTSTAVGAPLLDLRWRGASGIDATTRAGSLNPDSNYTFGATSAAAADASSSTNPANVPIEGFSGGGPVQLIATTICPNGGTGPCTGVAGGGGQTVGAPTWTAADGVSVSGVGSFGSGNCPAIVQGDCRFFGTSAAVPHAAAIAALARQAIGGNPSPLVITQRLALTATDRGTPGFDNVWGFGVLNALAVSSESADLSVFKDCKPDGPIAAGQAATCTIVVDNHGPTLARNVVLTDTHIGSGAFTIGAVTTSQGTCVIASNVVTCALGNLPAAAPGVSGRATVTVNVSATQAADINDFASVVSDTPDPDPDNNFASDGVSVFAVANLSITKTSAPNPVVAGTNVSYTINVANAGPSTATNVVVQDTLPAQVSDVTFTPSTGSCMGGIPGNPAQPLTCNLGNLVNGAAASIVVTAKVKPDTPDGTILVNNASVGSDVADSNGGNNVATALTNVIARADLAIVKTSDKTVYKPSSLITYTVTVTNNGPSDALAVVVTDTLPDAQQALYLSDTGGCTKSGGILTCNVGTLPIGQSRSFNINLTVKGSRGAVSNTASVSSSTTDPSGANNTSTRIVTVGH